MPQVRAVVRLVGASYANPTSTFALRQRLIFVLWKSRLNISLIALRNDKLKRICAHPPLHAMFFGGLFRCRQTFFSHHWKRPSQMSEQMRAASGQGCWWEDYPKSGKCLLYVQFLVSFWRGQYKCDFRVKVTFFPNVCPLLLLKSPKYEIPWEGIKCNLARVLLYKNWDYHCTEWESSFASK